MSRLSQPVVIAMLLLGAPACADLVGADFDNLRPRSSGNTQNDAGSSDSPRTDGSERNTTVPPAGSSDADRDDRHVEDDAATDADAIAWSDATDVGDGGPIDAGSSDDGEIQDANNGSDGGPYDGGPYDGGPYDGGPYDGGGPPRDSRWAQDADDAPDGSRPLDAREEPPPDGPGPTGPIGVVGGFVSLGAPGTSSSTIQLRGQLISNAALRGVTSKGISIEGRLQ